jgi:tellurite methyltransferase
LTVGVITPVRIEAGATSILRIPVQVAPGYRVQANPASNEFLVPLELVIAKLDGFRFGGPVYPEPEAYRLEGADDDLLTYRGDIDIIAAVSADRAAIAGARIVAGELRFQACNSRRCLFPDVVRIVIQFDVVESVMSQETTPGEPDRERWDRKFASSDFIYGKEPARFLEGRAELLPAQGRALDVAAGEGRNAVFLARQGLEVDAVDISEVGLAKARQLADEAGVNINTIVADLSDYAIAGDRYDVVVVINYLQRDLIDDLKAALKPGGIVIYETYTAAQQDISGAHQLRREYLLKPGELRAMFEDFEILEYCETVDDRQAVASLVARKPTGS